MPGDVVAKIVFNNLPKLSKQVRVEAGRIVQRTALKVHRNIALSFAAPKGGREYRRGNKVHVASAPGEAPAIDTGNLAGTVQSQMVDDLHAIVFTNAPYAPVLEYGGVKMAARPFMAPALALEAEPFEQAMERLLRSLK